MAKKQQEEEEAASSAAIAKAATPAAPAPPPAPAAPHAPPAPAAPPALSAPAAAPSAPSPPAAPPAPAAPPMPPRAPSAVSAVPKSADNEDDWDADDKSGSDDDMGPIKAPPFVNMGARPASNIPQAPPPPPAPGAQTGAAEAVLSVDKEKADEEREASEQAERLDKLKLAEEEAHEAAAVSRPRGESAVSQGKKAKVLYDYQAEEGNELDLAEGEIVTDIDQIDDGWWSGTVDGRTGLFPGKLRSALAIGAVPDESTYSSKLRGTGRGRYKRASARAVAWPGSLRPACTSRSAHAIQTHRRRFSY